MLPRCPLPDNELKPDSPGVRVECRSAQVGSARRGDFMSNTRHHGHQHAFADFHPLEREGLVLLSRRNMLKASLAGLGGLTVPGLLRCRAKAAAAGRPAPTRKS